MRARYSAYAKGLVDYVVKTTHPENSLQPGQPGSTLADDVRATCDKIGCAALCGAAGQGSARGLQQAAACTASGWGCAQRARPRAGAPTWGQ